MSLKVWVTSIYLMVLVSYDAVLSLTAVQIRDFRAYIRAAAAPHLNITHSSEFDALPPVWVHHRHIPDSQFPRIYRACDALVIPTHGEGWGRPQIEVSY